MSRAVSKTHAMKNNAMFDADKVASWQLVTQIGDSHFSLPMGQKILSSILTTHAG
jgi:hypothetical protein